MLKSSIFAIHAIFPQTLTQYWLKRKKISRERYWLKNSLVLGMSLLYFILYYLFIFMIFVIFTTIYAIINHFSFFFAGSLCFYDHFRDSLIFPFVATYFLSWLLSRTVFLQDIHTLLFPPHAIFCNIAIFPHCIKICSSQFSFYCSWPVALLSQCSHFGLHNIHLVRICFF